MSFGFGDFVHGEGVWGEIVEAGAPNPFIDFINSPDSFVVFVLDVTPENLSGADERLLACSSRVFHTSSADTPADTIILPRLRVPYSFDVEIPFPSSGGRGRGSGGTVVIVNTDRDLDRFLSREWKGKEIKVWAGGIVNPGRPDEYALLFKEYGLALRGVVEAHTSTKNEVSVILRDFLGQLSTPFQTSTYDGDFDTDPTTLEGDDSLKGQPKPVALGRVFNVPAVLVNPGLRIYQWSDASVQSVDELRDKGVVLTAGPDVTLGEITDAGYSWPGGALYVTHNALGLVRLKNNPDGRITLDGQGDNVGGYVETTPDLILRVTTTRGGPLVSPDDIDGASLTRFPHRGPVGYFATGENVDDIVSRLADGADGWVAPTRDGKLEIGVWRQPSAAPADFSLGNVNAMEVVEDVAPHRVFRLRFGYKPMWAVQSEDDLAASVTADKRALYSQPRSYVVEEDLAVQTSDRLAVEIESESYFALDADAAAVAATKMARDKAFRRVIRYRGRRQLLSRRVGEVAFVSVAQQDLDIFTGTASGRNMVVMGVAEDGATRGAELLLWG